jgi:hypothetical protein
MTNQHKRYKATELFLSVVQMKLTEETTQLCNFTELAYECVKAIDALNTVLQHAYGPEEEDCN